MYPNNLFDFWWLFAVFMILCCLFMCLSRRHRGMVRGCMGWCAPRETPWHGRADDGSDTLRNTDRSMPALEQAEAKTLKRTFDRLERRLRNLEEVVTSKELDWKRRLDQS